MTWTGWAWDADAGRWCAVSEGGSPDDAGHQLLTHAADTPTDWRAITGGGMPSWTPAARRRRREPATRIGETP